MDKQSKNKLTSSAQAGAVIGSLQRSEEDAVVFGKYKAKHRRVALGFEGAAADLAERLSMAQVAGNDALLSALQGEFDALPRSEVGDYDAPNLLTDVGVKLMEDTILAGSAFTAATYLGLKGTGTAAVTDTQASHSGWSEVGGTNAPAYTAPRKTLAWSAASGTGAASRVKNSSGTFTFSFTSAGTVDGAFLNINGTSAIDNTTGSLFSAGTFSGGSKTVAIGDTLTVTYSLTA